MVETSIGILIWKAFVAGLIATAGMELTLRKINDSGLANADMCRAIGSLFTKSLDNAYKVGIIIHFISGICFAFIYSILFSMLNITSMLHFIGAGLLLGFIHGVVVSFMLVITVAEHHPLKEFRETGFSVAVAHWSAHLVYGLLIGLILGLMS